MFWKKKFEYIFDQIKEKAIESRDRATKIENKAKSLLQVVNDVKKVYGERLDLAHDERERVEDKIDTKIKSLSNSVNKRITSIYNGQNDINEKIVKNADKFLTEQVEVNEKIIGLIFDLQSENKYLKDKFEVLAATHPNPQMLKAELKKLQDVK